MKHPKVGVGVFVWRNSKFIIMKRNGAHGEGTWSIPGGHLEFGETWEECAKREVLEETGMEIGNIRFLTATNDLFKEENKHYVTIWVSSDWVKNEPENLEPEKCTEMRWITMNTLPKPLFNPCWENLKQQLPDLFFD